MRIRLLTYCASHPSTVNAAVRSDLNENSGSDMQIEVQRALEATENPAMLDRTRLGVI